MRVRRIQLNAGTTSTTPGYENLNRQAVIRDTGYASQSFPGQRIYHLRCRLCAFDYGANGTDVSKRLCPNCQGGAPGERLREARTASLFD